MGKKVKPCKFKENNNVMGYVEIPKGYWTTTTTSDIDNSNKYWHNNED